MCHCDNKDFCSCKKTINILTKSEQIIFELIDKIEDPEIKFEWFVIINLVFVVIDLVFVIIDLVFIVIDLWFVMIDLGFLCVTLFFFFFFNKFFVVLLFKILGL